MTWIARRQLEALSPEDRTAALLELRTAIDARLDPKREWEAYWVEVKAVIAELKAAGHDLWSWDYDGERGQLWGWDYMRPEQAGRLQIQFTFEGPCRTWWRDEEWRLGVDRDDDG
jgi:hypothetical protein